MNGVTGFITAGGQSSRMGTDKAWLELGGRAMIEHVIAAITPVTTKVAIIANSPDYERLGFTVFADSHTRIGPLEAIRTALANALTPMVILVGCDLPFVTTDLFKFLLSIAGNHQATVPIGADGILESLCAIYRREALPAVTDLIKHGERKVSLLFDRVPTRLVRFEELRNLPGSELFFENVNTPEDYARVRERLRLNGGYTHNS
jgi:molybdopterin-guanine dinucleotide biosynthesis protein A